MSTGSHPRQSLWPVAVVLFVSLLVYSAVAAPVPGINEPHYLGKAKHYWNPAWCAGDLFLESANAHQVFYQAVGWLTLWLTLEQTAWIGRVAALLLLATGWTACLSQLVPGRWSPLWTVWGFLALLTFQSFSGEWIVGGVEGKVFSYGFLFWSLALLFAPHPVAAAACAGLAISFHPVVGLWGVIAALMAAVCLWLLGRFQHRVAGAGPKGSPGTASGQSSVVSGSPRQTLSSATDQGPPTTDKSGASQSLQPQPPDQPMTVLVPWSWGCWLIALVVLVLCALPGLIPAVQLLRVPVSPQTAFQADYIQIFFRLPHHLDPRTFPRFAYLWYGILLGGWLSAWWFIPPTTFARRFFTAIVAASAVIALAGLAIGWLNLVPAQQPWFSWKMTVLKFYPFRLFDALLPLAVSVAVFSWFQNGNEPRRTMGRRLIGSGLGMGAFLFALWIASASNNPSRMTPRQRADWIDACRWINEHLPQDVLVRTPRDGWAFKWYAQRPEYVNFKDCPQDAAGIVEWHRRRVFIAEWLTDHYADEFFSTAELRDLRAETGITHLLTDRLGPIEPEPIYRNGTYRVYELPRE